MYGSLVNIIILTHRDDTLKPLIWPHTDWTAPSYVCSRAAVGAHAQSAAEWLCLVFCSALILAPAGFLSSAMDEHVKHSHFNLINLTLFLRFWWKTILTESQKSRAQIFFFPPWVPSALHQHHSVKVFLCVWVSVCVCVCVRVILKWLGSVSQWCYLTLQTHHSLL